MIVTREVPGQILVGTSKFNTYQYTINTVVLKLRFHSLTEGEQALLRRKCTTQLDIMYSLNKLSKP